MMLFFFFLFAGTKAQTIIITYDPLKNGLGFFIQGLEKRFNPSLSYELGKYDENKVVKYSIGISYLYDENCPKRESTYFNLSLCLNQVKGDAKDKVFIISPEIGGTIKIKNQAFLIMFDPMNWEGKIGFGITF